MKINILNGALFALGPGLSVSIFFVAPLTGGHGILFSSIVIGLAAATAPLQWGLMHEAVHGSLSATEKWNRTLGRVCGWFLGYSWEITRFFHLAHHRFNRHGQDRPDEWKEGASWPSSAVAYYAQLLGGHALSSALAGAVFFAPPAATSALIRRAARAGDYERVAMAALRHLLDPVRRQRIRTDFVMTTVLFGLAMWAWSDRWPVLVACIVARWSVLSLLENAPHYATPRSAGHAAKNMAVPRVFAWILLNQNFHTIHHELPDLTWCELSEEFDRRGGCYDASWTSLVLAQFRGPVRLPGAFSPDTPASTPPNNAFG